MGANDIATEFCSEAVDREPEMRAEASTAESKFLCDKENDGGRTGKRPKIERKRVERTPNRSDNDKVKKWGQVIPKPRSCGVFNIAFPVGGIALSSGS